MACEVEIDHSWCNHGKLFRPQFVHPPNNMIKHIHPWKAIRIKPDTGREWGDTKTSCLMKARSLARRRSALRPEKSAFWQKARHSKCRVWMAQDGPRWLERSRGSFEKVKSQWYFGTPIPRCKHLLFDLLHISTTSTPASFHSPYGSAEVNVSSMSQGTMRLQLRNLDRLWNLQGGIQTLLDVGENVSLHNCLLLNGAKTGGSLDHWISLILQWPSNALCPPGSMLHRMPWNLKRNWIDLNIWMKSNEASDSCHQTQVMVTISQVTASSWHPTWPVSENWFPMSLSQINLP